MEALMMLVTAGGSFGVGLAIASVAMNATLRLVHHISRASDGSAMGRLLS